MSGPSASEQTQVEEYLAAFGTKETALFLSKSQYGIDTDKKDAKGEKVKLSKGVLSVSSRLTIFQKGSIFNRSLSVIKEYHLLDLLEISCAIHDRDLVYFRFRTDKAPPSPAEQAAAEASGVPGTVGTQLVTIRDTRTNLLVKNVRESLRRMTCGVHPYFDVKVIIPPDQLDELSPTFSVGPAEGFELAYLGHSNYNRSTPRPELIQYVEDLHAQKIVELDLGEVPGCEGKSELALDFGAIGGALSHNMYFRSLKMVDVPQKLALQTVGNMLGSNSVITKVVMRNNDAHLPPEVGEAFSKNMNLQLQILDVSGNTIENHSMVTLALGIREVTRQLTVLGLANCGLNDKSISSLFSALKSNWGFSLSLQDFDLSGNKLDSCGNEALSTWLSAMKGNSRLRRLALSGCTLDALKVIPEIKLQLNLEYLDVSHNNLRKITTDAWYVDCMPASDKLSVFNLSHTNISIENVASILTTLSNNAKLSKLTLGLSGLVLSSKGARLIGTPLAISNNIEIMDLSINDFGKSGGIALFPNLPATITRLSLAGNFRSSDEWVEKELSNMIKKQQMLRSLDLSGRSKARLKGSLAKLSSVLQTTFSLTELDISNNHMKDEAFAQICQALRTNSSLKTIHFDDNLLTVNGHQAFLRMSWYNRVLTDWTYPINDLEAAGSHPRHRKVLEDIQRHIHSNGESVTAQIPNPFSWSIEWPIPASPAPAFVDVPEYLKPKVDDGMAVSPAASPRASVYVAPDGSGSPLSTTRSNRSESQAIPPMSANYLTTTTSTDEDTPTDLPPPVPRSARASVVPPPAIDYSQQPQITEAPPRLNEPPAAPPAVAKKKKSLKSSSNSLTSSSSASSLARAGPEPTKQAPPPPAPPSPPAAPPQPVPVAVAAPPTAPPMPIMMAPPAPAPPAVPQPPPGGPPLPPPAAPPAPKANSKPAKSSKSGDGPKLGGGDPKDNSDLLNSISGFKGGLRKVQTNDRSAPSF